jgi:ParB/RepB/Spo0J family partition protein
MTAEEILQLDPNLIEPNPDNPRGNKFEIADLIEGVKASGVLVPLIIRPQEGAKPWRLVAGHRRLAAALKLELPTVPCIPRTLDEKAADFQASQENLQRVDLTPLEEADSIAHLLKRHGLTHDDAAALLGKPVAWVYRAAKLMNLGPEGRKLLDTGVIAAQLAIAVARIPSHQVQAAAAKELKADAERDGGTVNVRRGLEILHEDFCRSLKDAPFDLKDEFLDTDAGSCTKCPKRAGNGQLAIFEDLQRAPLTCTDLDCYDRKVKADGRRRIGELQAAGANVVKFSAVEKEFREDYNGNLDLRHAGELVKVDHPMSEFDSKGKTWRDALDKVPEDKRPKITATQLPTGEVVQLLKRTDALEAARAAGIKAKGGHVESPAEKKEKAQRKREGQRKRDSDEVRAAVADATEKKLAEKIDKTIGNGGPVLRAVLVHLLEPRFGYTSYRLAFFQGRDYLGEVTSDDVKAGKANERMFEWVQKKATHGQLVALLARVSGESNFLRPLDEGDLELAKLAGVEVKAIEKALDAADAAEAKKGKKSA